MSPRGFFADNYEVDPDETMPADFDPNDSQIGGHAPHWAASRARDLAHRNTTEDET